MQKIPLLAAAALAACSPQPGNDSPSAMNSPAPLDTAEPAPAPAPAPSATPEPARYVGRWAAKEQLCENGAWKFAEMDLSTAGEVSCDFHKVREVPGGYDVDATCLAEGTRSDETIKLRFAESAGAMLVESKTFNPVGLIRCEAGAG